MVPGSNNIRDGQGGDPVTHNRVHDLANEIGASMTNTLLPWFRRTPR